MIFISDFISDLNNNNNNYYYENLDEFINYMKKFNCFFVRKEDNNIIFSNGKKVFYYFDYKQEGNNIILIHCKELIEELKLSKF